MGSTRRPWSLRGETEFVLFWGFTFSLRWLVWQPGGGCSSGLLRHRTVCTAHLLNPFTDVHFKNSLLPVVKNLKFEETLKCLARCQITLTLFALNIVNRKYLQWALSLELVRSVK